MPFNKPTLQELVNRIQADLESRLSTQTPVGNNVTYSASLRRSTSGVLAQVQASASYLLLGYLDFLAKQVMVGTAESDYLYRWAHVWGVKEKSATFANGCVVFKGEEGRVIAEETKLLRSDGVEFKVAKAVAIKQRSATVRVEALLLGGDGNTPPNTTLTLILPLAGVQSNAAVTEAGITGGLDAEKDDSLRERLLQRIQEPPHGGAVSDYEQWAREVPGVARAFVYPNYFGLGTVGITFLSEGTDSRIPDVAHVARVQTHIDEQRPVTADVLVFAPTVVPVALIIKATSLNTTVQATIEAELRAWFIQKAYPGMLLRVARLQDVIFQATGNSEDYVLIVPAHNIQYAAHELPTLSEITWQLAT